MAELVVALDFNDALDALNMAGVLRGHAPWVKVGLELFISEGPRIIPVSYTHLTLPTTSRV